MSKPQQLAKKRLPRVMRLLRELNKEGKINGLTEQPRLLNTDFEYTYVSFRIPEEIINTTRPRGNKTKEIFNHSNIVRDVLE